MSISPAYRLPGVALLAVLGGAGVYAAHDAEQVFRQTSTRTVAAPGQTLVLLTHDADVKITSGTGRNIRIERRARWVGQKPSDSMRVSPGSSERIELRDGCPGGVGSATAVFAFDSACSVSYEVQVPAGQKLVVTVEAGDIELRDLSGDVTAYGASGDIDASGMHTTKLHMASQSGDVTGSFATAPALLSAGASSGDVSLRVPAGGYRLRVTTNSGDRSIDGISADPASKHRIVAATSSGDVSIGRSN